jgi:hypothetical protein
VHLIAMEPEEKAFYRYTPNLGWTPMPQEKKGARL